MSGSTAPSFRIAVLASGAGTNLQAILDRVHGREGIEVVAVASNNAAARALERAQSHSIATEVFARDAYADREARDAALAGWLEQRAVDLVVLAGYMELLSAAFVARFRNRILNVHPALLPAFPGLDAVGEALDYGVRVTGVTVHFVDEGVDSGPVVLQQAVPVPADRDREALERSIHAVEHELLPRAIRLVAQGRVRFDEANPRIVHVHEEASSAGRA